MNVRVAPGKVGGTIQAIASKSHAHRLLICAALSQSKTRIVCREVSEDIACTAQALGALCADIVYEDGAFVVSPRAPSDRAVIDCGESGSTYRFLLPVAAALGGEFRFILHGRLPHRPMGILFKLLKDKGIAIEGEGSSQVTIKGKLAGGIYHIAGNVSSQFISGLLLCAPLTGERVEIRLTTPLQSAAYVDITKDAAKQFSVTSAWADNCLAVPQNQSYRSPGEARVEGDWSNAAFWLCAAAAGKSEVTMEGLDADSSQGDKSILQILRGFGADVTEDHGLISIGKSHLNGCSVDVDATPDLAPAIALLGLASRGETVIHHISRLRLKESDRALTITQTIKALGADITLEDDLIRIRGGGKLRGGLCAAQGDHRIVMMAACAAVLCEQDVIIAQAQAVSKSYPTFFEDLARLGMSVSMEG